jgi:alkaline phosphatase D
MAKFKDPDRRMMSPQQEAWLGQELSGSVKAGQPWQLVATGVVMGRLIPPNPATDLPADAVAAQSEDDRKRLTRMGIVSSLKLPYGLDMWDGYPADRERVYDQFKQAKARPIVISGDSHAFWANELADASGRRVACEFGGTSITSNGADDGFKGLQMGPGFVKASPEVKFCDQGAKGFVVLTFAKDAVRSDLMAVSTIASKTFTTKALKTYRVTPDGAGISGLKEV